MDEPTVRLRAFAAADRLELTRDERIELAEMLLKVDVDSWKHLTDRQFARLVDALDGAHLVETLKAMRPS